MSASRGRRANQPRLEGLDFLVVGASKAGTTTLFQLLRQHPDIYIPPHKDAPIFTGDHEPREVLEARLTEHFEYAPPDKLWGTVTPSYMEDLRLPSRMQAFEPRLKLIALLRDPIERAHSHFRQQRRLGKAKGSFAGAMGPLLDDADAGDGASMEQFRQVVPYHPVRGNYGMIMRQYRAAFQADQLLVLFTEDLASDPGAILDRIAAFLGARTGFRPSNLRHRYHVGGRQRFPGLIETLRGMAPLRAAWHVVPLQHRRAAWTWFFTSANVVAEEADLIPDDIRERLARFWAPDVEELIRLTGVAPPWSMPGREHQGGGRSNG